MSFAYAQPDARNTIRILLINAGAHFRLRVSSWFMATVDFAVGIMLTINPEALTGNPGANVFFVHLVNMAPPPFWRAAFLIIGTMRFCALVINGTFPSVWWTPHMRVAMSFLSAMIWFSISASILDAGVPGLGSVIYPAVAMIEVYNIAIAAMESRHSPGGHLG